MKSVLNPCVLALGLVSLTVLSGCESTSDMVPSAVAAETNTWSLSSEDSGMTFITIHNRDVSEINTFREIAGSVNSNGEAKLTIALNSIDSNVSERDNLYRSTLFETQKYPELTVTAPLDMTVFANLAIGERHTELLDITIDLHGIEMKQKFYVMVTRLGEDKVLVENKAPLLLKASDFGFEGAVAEMGRISGISDITTAVTITLSLIFER